MIKVYGKIQTLKSIRETLNARGLSDFNSIGEINAFLLNYDSQVRRAKEEAELQVESEQERLEIEKLQLEQQLTQTRERAQADISNEIANLQLRIADREPKESTSTFHIIVNKVISTVLRLRLRRIENSRENRIKKATTQPNLELDHVSTSLSKYTTNKSGAVEERFTPKLRKLINTKEVLEEIQPLVAGAVGESMVEEELKNLSVTGVLLNDFYLKFNPPIYNKKVKDRIFSIQIDHLLITRAGVFLLETKNWSKESIERLDLRSPVVQIERLNYAMFVLVNSTDNRLLGLDKHHWGKKHIPLRNLIIMIGHKPRSNFKFVMVKTLSELNSYIEYFEPIFSDEEVDNIASYLRGLQQDYPSEYIPKRKTATYNNPVFYKDAKNTSGKTKRRFGVITLLIIIFSSIGTILYFQSKPGFQPESSSVILKKKAASSSSPTNYFIVKEDCPTYTKPNIESSISGYLVIGNEIHVENVNKYKYFYQVPDKNGKKRYVKKECLRKP